MCAQFEDFVPDLAAASALLTERGLAGVAAAQRFALIGVSGRVLVRKSWTDDVEVSERLFAELSAQREPERSLDISGVREHRSLDPASHAARPGRCGQCWMTPGAILCAACDGDGKLGLDDDSTECKACAGAGNVVCPTCDGSGKSVRVKLVFSEDRTTEFAHVFVPELPIGLPVALAKFIKARESVPGVLSFDLSEELEGRDAYRGRRGDEEYRGHRLGSALARARQYVERVERAPSVIASRASASVWPFALLELESGASVVALALDEHLAPQLISA